MSAPKVTPTRLRPAVRTYSFVLDDAEPITDRQGRRLQPRELEISIGDETLHARIGGTHIKANGEIGVAYRSVSWYSKNGDTSRFNDGPIPAWVALEIYRCQVGRPIAGPVFPTEWAAQLLPSENE